jgi:hypothetical protein
VFTQLSKVEEKKRPSEREEEKIRIQYSHKPKCGLKLRVEGVLQLLAVLLGSV